MTLQELSQRCGLTLRRAQIWVESGLIESMPGRRREFGEEQIQRARVIQELQRKGVALLQLTGTNMTFPESGRFVVFDGHELRTCRDAEAAIGVVARARRPCAAVDLGAVRAGLTP